MSDYTHAISDFAGIEPPPDAGLILFALAGGYALVFSMALKFLF